MATGHRHAAAARMRIGGLDNSVEEFAMTRTTMKPRASLTVRIVLAVMAALLVMAALWAIVNLAAVNSYNQATQSLQENISTSRKDDADWDKLHTRQQQTDAQFNEASAMKPLLLPQVRESIEHNSHVSSQLTDHASKKIKAEQSDQSASTDSNTADAQESGKSSHKNDENLSDEQRRKIEELLAQNAQSTQSDPNDDSGSAAKKNPSTSSSQTKPW
jgi:cell division protein FtsB